MRGKRARGAVPSDGALSEDWKKTTHSTSWQRFERTFTQRQSFLLLEREAARRKIPIHRAHSPSGLLSTDTTPKRRLYFNTTTVTGMDVENVDRQIVTKSSPTTTKHAKTGSSSL